MLAARCARKQQRGRFGVLSHAAHVLARGVVAKCAISRDGYQHHGAQESCAFHLVVLLRAAHMLAHGLVDKYAISRGGYRHHGAQESCVF